jgi:hypothetical protein
VSRPSISVVIAEPHGAARTLRARVAFSAEILPDLGDELIVEAGETGSVLIPELWRRGIEKARGEIVALSLGSMEPDRGWRDAVERAMEGPYAGVGGAIEPAAKMRRLDWAIHLARYSSYLLPFEARDAEDLPGDNAAYRRDAIEACRSVWADGFWETEVDAWLRLRGERLRLTPEMVVRQGRSLGFLGFCANRLRHGVRSGQERARRLSLAGRIARAAAFPAAALVMMNRIGRLARSRGRGEGFRRGLPFLALFLLVWTFGEGIGYLRGR